MTNELKERLEALKEKSEQTCLSECEREFRMELATAFRSGDLITRQELDEAVADTKLELSTKMAGQALKIDDLIARAVALEREACAKLVEQDGSRNTVYQKARRDAAAKIRARSEQKGDKPGLDVAILTMKLSGNREEYYVRISCGGRSIEVGHYPQGYMNRAQYQHDMLRHVIFDEPRPRLADEKYSDPTDNEQKEGE